MKETNNTAGTITADHAKEIIEVFGDKGREIAEALKADPSETMLNLLFKGFAG